MVGVTARDWVDHDLAQLRMVRRVAPIALLTLIAFEIFIVIRAFRDPGQWYPLGAIEGGGLLVAGVGLWILALRFNTREKYIRAVARHRARRVYHDPSSTRMCPRCGLPLDRVMSGAFYTGPPSPEELCHRCLHTDESGEIGRAHV